LGLCLVCGNANTVSGTGYRRHACSLIRASPNVSEREPFNHKGEKNYGNEKSIYEKGWQNISKRNGED
jgi:hypothetical protein